MDIGKRMKEKIIHDNDRRITCEDLTYAEDENMYGRRGEILLFYKGRCIFTFPENKGNLRIKQFIGGKVQYQLKIFYINPIDIFLFCLPTTKHNLRNDVDNRQQTDYVSVTCLSQHEK